MSLDWPQAGVHSGLARNHLDTTSLRNHQEFIADLAWGGVAMRMRGREARDPAFLDIFQVLPARSESPAIGPAETG